MITETITIIFYTILCIVFLRAFHTLRHMKNNRHLYNNGAHHNSYNDGWSEFEEELYKLPNSAHCEFVRNFCPYCD